jgi:16S rRNA processing protein RimM
MSRSQPEPDLGRLTVGTVGRPHGLDGSFHLAGHGGGVELGAGLAVQVGDRPARIANCKGTADRPILRLDIAASREQVDELRGQQVSVDRSEVPDPDEGEFFQVDLVGCSVWAGERLLGDVADVLTYPAHDVLDVTGGPEPVQVPFVEDVVLGVDLGSRRISIREDFL